MSNLDPVVQIGDWYYQVIYGQLWPVSAPTDSEQMIRLEPRLHSLLNFFLLHPNKLLAKDTLIEKVWPVEEGTDAAVMRAVGALRKVLGDDVRAPSYIATVSKKGYCWLAEIKTGSLLESQLTETSGDNDNPATSDHTASGMIERWPWRFIAATAMAVIIGCASLAYLLAKFTAVPLVKLPDTISPVSALSGQEYWSAFNAEQNYVVYQHKAPNSNTVNLSKQNLTDLRVEHLPQQYLQLSQPLWQDPDHIIFRARNEQQQCYIYRQQLLPDSAAPAMLWPCNRVMSQAMVRWQQQWLWLDSSAADNAVQLWSGVPDSEKVLVRTLPFTYRKLEHMLVRNDMLYLLAQETQNNSVLITLQLPDGKPEQIAQFPYLIEQFSWWDKTRLLLAPAQQELQIYDLQSQSTQGLGPLTRELTQAVRYSDQVLATQFLDYTTDILQFTQTEVGIDLTPWHVSNRSERLITVAKRQTAFVSERAGHSQIWLADGANSTQLTRLTEQQQVQQLLWHHEDLLVLINSKLYRLQLNTSELSLYHLQSLKPGRYASCDNQLYWTELTEHGWVLFTEQDNKARQLYDGVVDVRCAPDHSLVLQFAVDNSLAVLRSSGQLEQLPVAINWRQQSAEQWFVDNTGIYWLQHESSSIQSYKWVTDKINGINWPESDWPVAIYSNGNGLGYVVRPRPHDTDIVWLHNRR